MALLWCEARCDQMGLSHDCVETSQGAFGVVYASKAAKRQGWKIIGGEWVCPHCAKELTASEATRP